MTSAQIANVRQLVCRDKGDGRIEWLLPDVKRAKPAPVCIRRWYPDGLTEWYGVPDRDATEDDLVDSHGALAFDFGLAVGLIEQAWSSVPIEVGEDRARVMKQAIRERVEEERSRQRDLLNGRYGKGFAARSGIERSRLTKELRGPVHDRDVPERLSRWDYLKKTRRSEVSVFPIASTRAFDFSYSRAFLQSNEKSELAQWSRLRKEFQRLRSHSVVKISRHRHEAESLAKSLVASSAQNAFDQGRRVASQLWTDLASIERVRNEPRTYIELALQILMAGRSQYDEGQTRATSAALWFLSELQPDHFLTFSENLAKPAGLGEKSSPTHITCERVTESKQPRKKPGPSGLGEDIIELLKECRDKWADVPPGNQFNEKFRSVFPGLAISDHQFNRFHWPRRTTRKSRGRPARK